MSKERSLSIDYIAGFFDGEGSISIVPKGRSWSLVAQCGQINPIVLYYMQAQWGGRIFEVKTTSGRAYFKWAVHGLNAFKFINDVEPHLLIKRAQAQLALEFKTIELNRHMPPLLRARIHSSRRQCAERMRNLNKRGIEAL